MSKYYSILDYKKILFSKRLIQSKYSLKKKKRINLFQSPKALLKCLFIIILSLAFFLMIITQKKMKLCICTIGKKENLYVKEYANYYKKLGYNHIFIYDNNEENDEKFEEVLQEEINSNFVTIINLRGERERYHGGGPQCYAFQDCYEKNKNDYDWLSFFDLDEFLEISPKFKNIQEYFGNKMFDKCVNIKINFLFYGDNELLYYDPRPLQERFTKPLYDHGNNDVIKSTIRGGLNYNYWEKGCTPHTSVITNATSCTSYGKIIEYKAGSYPKNFTYAALKHYYSKTVEEYAVKSKRGDAFSFVKWDENRKRYKINNYFKYNKRTEEKENLFKKLFNLTIR